MRSTWPKQAGAALLELLAGMTLLGLLLALLNQSSYFIHLRWRELSRGPQMQESVFSCQQAMLRQVRSASIPASSRAGGTGYSTRQPQASGLTGDHTSVTFITSQPLGREQGIGLWRVTYALEPGSRGQGLLLTAYLEPALADEPKSSQKPQIQPRILLQGLQQARFTYISIDRSGKHLLSTERWPIKGGSALPAALHLEASWRDEILDWHFPFSCSQTRVVSAR
ncbi:MAG: hypothetical protein PVG60_07985 [Desulfarculaceae bacterium]|jgi:hypothetical protein